MKLSTAALTDIGSRVANNDYYNLDESLHLYLLADGSGKVALDRTTPQELALKTISNYLHDQSLDQPTWPFQLNKAKNFYSSQLSAAIKLADQTVFQKGEADFPDDIDLNGFGAFLVALWFTEETLLIAHAGDCRAYRIRGRIIEALTEDHTLLNEYLRMKPLTPKEIEDFPHKHITTRRIGAGKETRTDIRKETPQQGDIYLLCTSSLHENVTNEEMLTMIEEAKSLPEACQSLIAAATKNPRCPNCTVVLVRVES